MQKERSLQVNAVWDGREETLQDENIQYLEVEWYEVFRSRMKRKTNKGILVSMHKNSNEIIRDGEILFADDQRTIRLRIKACDCIVVFPHSLHEMGRICFEIGNKHIPIFLNNNQEVCVAYDANLYQLLSSGNFDMRLESRILHPDQMVKAYGNFFE